MKPYRAARNEVHVRSQGTKDFFKWVTWLGWGMGVAVSTGLAVMLIYYLMAGRDFSWPIAFFLFLFFFALAVVVVAAIYKTHKTRRELVEAHEDGAHWYHVSMSLAQNTHNNWNNNHHHYAGEVANRATDMETTTNDADRELSEEEYKERFGSVQPGKNWKENWDKTYYPNQDAAAHVGTIGYPKTQKQNMATSPTNLHYTNNRGLMSKPQKSSPPLFRGNRR